MKLSNHIHNAHQLSHCTHHRTKGFPPEKNAKIRKGQDVVSGKGEHVKQLNIHYRRLIRHYHVAYHHAETNQAKRAVAELVLNEIHKIGGRFLDTQFEEMDKKEAKHKVMKALKDAKKCCRKCRSTTPTALPSTLPSESKIEPFSLDTSNKDFNTFPSVLSPVAKHSLSDEITETEPLNLDLAAAAAPSLDIDSFKIDLLGIMVETTAEDPLDYSWAL